MLSSIDEGPDDIPLSSVPSFLRYVKWWSTRTLELVDDGMVMMTFAEFIASVSRMAEMYIC